MNPEPPLPRETAALVGAGLRPGEKIVWTSQPLIGRFMRKSIPLVLFGIPWTLFALFWIGGASAGSFAVSSHTHGGFGNFAWLFPMFGLPFVGIGLWMLSSPFWMRRQARRTAYVLTDQRAIILGAGFWNKLTVRSYAQDRLGTLSRVENRDGTGDLIFDQQWTTDRDGDRRSVKIGFLAIPNVKAVGALVQNLAAPNRRSE